MVSLESFGFVKTRICYPFGISIIVQSI
uniref:Uncharacterized protein n=1 Tax=Tetranychus urticae TaxID=32264 RepID=T1KJ20_TETUR